MTTLTRRDFRQKGLVRIVWRRVRTELMLSVAVEDDLELDREMEYLIEPEEALGGGGTIE
jgi:hypothetical protein